MGKVKIPEDYKPGFEEFLALSDLERERVLDVFSQNPYKTSNESMGKQVAEAISIDVTAATELTKSIDSLFFSKENGKLTLKELVDGIVEELATEAYNLDADRLPSIEDSLHKLFSKESKYYITSKAQNLISQRDHLLTKSRILTDIRPVFSDDEDCQIESEVIMHTLKVEYLKDYDGKAMYFALDLNDLAELKSQIERAQKKDALIRKGIGNLPESIIDPF